MSQYYSASDYFGLRDERPQQEAQPQYRHDVRDDRLDVRVTRSPVIRAGAVTGPSNRSGGHVADAQAHAHGRHNTHGQHPHPYHGQESHNHYAYESDGSASQSESENSDNEFEPAWADSVTSKGDVFYLEGGDEARANSPHRHHPNAAHSSASQSNSNRYSHPQSLEPSLQSAEVKKRGRRKLWGSGNNKKGEEVNGVTGSDHHGSHSVTFNDIPTGVMRDVMIYVDPNRHNYGRRATMCETLFGIIPGLFSTRSNESGGTRQDKRIMVQGLLPGGEGLKSGIKIGEWLMEVNGDEVDIDNIDAVLANISQAQLVELRLQKIAIQNPPRPCLVKKNNTVNNKLVRLVSGEGVTTEPVLSLQNVPHGLLYLTLDCSSENMQDREDVLYQFPHVDSKILDIRGMFITLSHLLLDVTDHTARNSTLLVGDKLVHVGYAKENREVLLLIVPANKLCLVQVNHMMDNIVRILKILYGSLHSAFSTPDNHQRLDHYFAILLQRTLLAEELLKDGCTQTELIEPFFDALPAVRVLTIPEDTKVVANNCLSDLEAADFADMSDDFYHMRRSYTIVGSCLFYKGYLLCNHLHSEDLQDVYVYASQHCLLTLCQQDQLGQLLVWKELFPTRCCHKQVDPLIPGYTEPEARWFLLLVGRRNGMLAVLLEAGGCAAWAEGNPAPDPFYVDQARATLLQLEAKDVFNQCEIRLQNPSVVTLACADYFLPAQKTSKSEQSVSTANKPSSSTKPTSATGKKSSQPESILKKRNVAVQMDNQRYDVGGILDVSDDDVESTGTSEGSAAMMERHGHTRKASQGSDESVGSAGSSTFFKGSRKRRNLPSAYDLSSLQRSVSDAAEELGSFVKLTSGLHNTLFHYVEFEAMEGVYVCPTQQELLQVLTPTHSKVLRNFQQACLAIRQLFGNSAKLRDQKETGEVSKFGRDWTMEGVQEHGILFHCQAEGWTEGKKPAPRLAYWVVGRVFRKPYPREFFVCFHDSCHQNMVEMAFKLAFGLLV